MEGWLGGVYVHRIGGIPRSKPSASPGMRWGVFPQQAQIGQLFPPCSPVVRGEGLMASLLEDILELHDLPLRIQSTCAAQGALRTCILLGPANRSTVRGRLLRPDAPAHSSGRHMANRPRALCCHTLRRRVRGGRDRADSTTWACAGLKNLGLDVLRAVFRALLLTVRLVFMTPSRGPRTTLPP